MKFTQQEIEGQLSDAIPNETGTGTRKDIAAWTGIYPSIVSAWFNADDERKSPHFTVLHVQSELDEKAPGVGDAVWAVMNRVREANRPTCGVRENADLTTQILRQINTAANAIKESSSAISDGSISKSEAERLITALHHLQRDAGTALRGLHARLGEIAGGNELRQVS